MKIAFLTHEPFYPPSGGGSAEAIYLVQEMVRRGHQVEIFCPRVTDPEATAAQFGVRLHQFTAWEMGRYTQLRTAKYLVYPFFLQSMVERAARTTTYDVVLSQHAISAVAAGRLKSRLQLPVVMNFLDFLTGFMETWPPYLAPPPLLKLLKRFELSLPSRYRANGLMTVSDTLADYFQGYPRERICPIYYGYDSDLFPFYESEPSVTTPPIMVMHGSLDHHHLRTIGLDAFCRIVQRRPDVIFRIVGHRTPALSQFLEQARQCAPQAKIVTPGFVPYRDISRQLNDATVGIVPYEASTGTHCAFVAKIVEYLAVGLPVVTTPLDSAKRFFGKEPMVKFSGFDGASFAQAVLEWLQQPKEQRRDQARAASARVRSELDWRAISKKAIDFVEHTIKTTQ